MKIYLAASAAPPELHRVNNAIAACRNAGFIVSSTWPSVVNAVGDANPRDATCEQRSEWAAQDLREVAVCDVLWMLVPHGVPTRGAWLEAGFAHALGKPLVFSGPSTHQSVFCALGEEFDSDDSALVHLKMIADASEPRSAR